VPFSCAFHKSQDDEASKANMMNMRSNIRLNPSYKVRKREKMRQIILGIFISSAVSGVSFAQDATLGEKVFIKCKVCHQIGDGAKTLVGPELNGIVGRHSGSVDGFSYSPGMKNSNLTWTDDNLSEYLKNPKQKVPGNKMAFVGLSKPDDISNVIAYLKQFDASGKKTP
jgi:cytochrome c